MNVAYTTQAPERTAHRAACWPGACGTNLTTALPRPQASRLQASYDIQTSPLVVDDVSLSAWQFSWARANGVIYEHDFKAYPMFIT